MYSHDEPLAIDCYVRGGARPAPTGRLVERLRNLEAGPVRDVAVHGWPSTVSLADSLNERALDVYDSFAEWASDRGASLRPAFEIRHASSLITDESTRELVTPVLCVGVYTCRELVGVFPHTTEGVTYTVEDLANALETGAAVGDASPAIEPPTDRPSSPDGRPPKPDDHPSKSGSDTTDVETDPDAPDLR